MGEVETRPVPSYYDQNQPPSLTSALLLLFDKVHIKQVSVQPTTSQKNEYSVFSPRDEEGKVDVERGVYDMNNQPKWETFKYEQEGQFCLGVAKVEGK